MMLNRRIKIALALVLVVVLMAGCEKKLITNSKKNSETQIIDINIDTDGVVAQTNKNELYSVGKKGMYRNLGLPKDMDSTDKPIKVASNVKKFYRTGTELIYISNDNDLYKVGLNYRQGGVYGEFTKLFSNIKDCYTSGFVLLLVNQNNSALVDFSKSWVNGNHYYGLTKEYNFEEVAQNVKKLFASQLYFYNGYVSTNNEYYIAIDSDVEYQKKFDNVKDISKDGSLILQNDGTLYKLIIPDYSNKKGSAKFVKIASEVDKVGDGYFQKGNKTYVIKSNYNSSSNESIRYVALDQDNISKLLYISTSKDKYICLNKDNKLEFYSKDENYTLDYKVSNLKNILDFVQKEN